MVKQLQVSIFSFTKNVHHLEIGLYKKHQYNIEYSLIKIMSKSTINFKDFTLGGD